MSEYNESEFRKEEFEKQIKEELAALEPKEEAVPSSETAEHKEDSEESSSKERTYTELELEQMEKGWDPDHPDGVSAKEFKRVGEIIEAKRKASKEAQIKGKEVEELTKTVKQLIDDQRLTKKMAYEQALKDLSLQKLEKIREGDVDAVLEIEQRQQSLAAARPTAQEASQPAPLSAEVVAFQEENKDWLDANNKDPKAKAMRGLVREMLDDYKINDPNISETKAIAEIRKNLKETFPDKFDAPKPKVSKVGASTASGSAKSTPTLSSLSFEQRAEYNAISRVDPTYSVEEYVKQLELVGRKSK